MMNDLVHVELRGFYDPKWNTTNFRYVPWESIEAYVALGWMILGPCPGHHGLHAAMAWWPCSCKMVEPCDA